LVRVLLLGEDDDLWIGTQNGGLNRFDRATGRITRYVSNPADPGSLGSGGITGLALDGEGMLWVATDDAGLHRLNPQTGAIQRFGVAEGLLDPRLMALVYVADPAGAGQGALWMSTGSGLARFDLATATFRNYDSSDGLPTGDFVPYAVYQSAQGELFFGGIDGFTAFMPQDIQGSRLQPMGQVSELYVNNVPATIGPQGLLADAVFATGAISLPAGSQSVTFLFAAPGYADARSVRFRFQLEGYNEDWVRAQPTQRGATYTNLDPGNYRFRLQAAGRDGIWGEPGRTLDVLLQPAWWQLWFVQPLAALAAAVLLGSIIVSVFQTRLRLTRRRNELLEQEVAARTTELSALLAVSQSITSEHDFDPLLVRVLDYVRDAIPHAGGILLLQNGSDAAVQSYRVASGAAVAKAGLPAAVFAVLTQVIGGGRSFAAGDLNGSGEALKPLIDLAQEDARATNWVGAPLLEQGRVVGSLLLYDVKPRHFSPDELPKLQRFANQLAIALENARLQAQAQQLAVDVERGRLSRELHDSVTQLLHSISLHANAAERALALGRPAHGAENMRQAQQLAQEAIHELRTLIFELRLTPLEEGGLVAALRAYLDTVVARSGVAVYLQAETQQRWTEDIEFELYRIAQEALTNVVKHAHASSVTVRLASTCAPDAAPCVTLEVADDGVGFDVAAAQDGRTLGLQSMAERAQKIGATLQVKSLGGRGTKVKVVLGHDKHKS
jgi:signal transduction histidine kinase